MKGLLPLLFSCLFLLPSCFEERHPNAAERIAAMDEEAFQAYLLEVADSVAIDWEGFGLETKLSPELCQTDLAVLKRVMEEAHTPMYRYCGREALERQFDEAFEAATDSLTYLELLREIAKIQSLIACSHSSWGHADGFKAFRKQKMRFFPIRIRIREGRFWVAADLSPEGTLEAGTEILEINDRAVSEVFAILKRHIIADGTSQSHFPLIAQDYFPNAYSNFIENPDSFRLKVRPNSGGETIALALPALSRSVLDSTARLRLPPPAPRGIPLRYTYLDSSSTGIFTIKWFNKGYIAHFGQDFESFTDSVFADLAQREARHLVIDVRDNPGGWTAYGKYLLSYLVEGKRPYMREVRVRKTGEYSFEPLLESESPYADTMRFDTVEQGLLAWANYPSLWVEGKEKNGFRGKVYALINGASMSCSSVFAGLLRENTEAEFIGQECGGAATGSGSMVISLRLPLSGIKLSLSTAEYETAVSKQPEGRGVMPDHALDVPGKTKGEGDLEMEKAMELISEQGGSK